jgi:large subunit ribosomal protein L5
MNENLKKWIEGANSEIKKELSLSNPMQIPKLEKIVINAGLKSAVTNSKAVGLAMDLLQKITSQLPVKTIAKKSIAGFKLREGMPIGTFVTLRGEKMYSFFYKLINLVFPKIKDFQGLSMKMDGRGNDNLGLNSQEVFPEGEVSGIAEFTTGVSITIVTSSTSDNHAVVCLKSFGMPFKDNKNKNKIKV